MKALKFIMFITILYATTSIYGMHQKEYNAEDPFNLEKINTAIANSRNLTSQTKLDNLPGDHVWHLRKAIIKKLIDAECLKPDAIFYQAPAAIIPMADAIIARDAVFIAYLIQNGANSNKAALEILQGAIAVSYFRE